MSEITTEKKRAPRGRRAKEGEPTGAEVRETRVREIMGLMSSGRWQGQHKELAALWGVSPGTIEHYAGEASRRVKATGETEYVRERLAAFLDHTLDLALRKVAEGDGRALMACAQLARTYGDLAGLRPDAKDGEPKGEPATFRIELSVPERPAPEAAPPEPTAYEKWAAMPDGSPEAARFYRQHSAEIEASRPPH